MSNAKSGGMLRHGFACVRRVVGAEPMQGAACMAGTAQVTWMGGVTQQPLNFPQFIWYRGPADGKWPTVESARQSGSAQQHSRCFEVRSRVLKANGQGMQAEAACCAERQVDYLLHDLCA